MEKENICYLCQSKNVKTLFALKQNPKHSVCHCKNCDVEYLFPQPTEEQIIEIYNDDYFDGWGVENGVENEITRNMKLSTFKHFLSKLPKSNSTGNILDIGCATGCFLEVAKELGYTPYGVEISKVSSEQAKAKFGNDAILKGTLLETNYPDNFFDVISMIDLLEHLPNAEEVLDICQRILKPEGIIIIVTPNNQSLSSKILRQSWGLYNFEHLFYYSLKSIQYIINRHNFSLVKKVPAVKTYTIDYFEQQFRRCNHPITPFFSFIRKILPNFITKIHFRMGIGDMLVILKKK